MRQCLPSALFAAPALFLAACSGIGDGNAPVELELRINNDAESAEVFLCQSLVPQAVLRFSDGSSGDFVRRVQWTSSDPDILTVSDGTIPAPQGFFVNGALLPQQPGEVTLRAEYLDGQFVDEIPVTVSASRLEVSPAYVVLPRNRAAQMIDTLVFLGEERFFSSDFNQVGDWSLLEVAADETDPPASITPVGEVRAEVPGLYTAEYDVEFCGARASSPVEALAEDVVELELRDRDSGAPLSQIELLLDSSKDIDVIGLLESGREITLTNSASYRFVDGDGEPVEDIAFASLRGLGTISAFARPETTPAGEEPVSYPREVFLRVAYDPTPEDADAAEEDDDIFAPDLLVRVLEAELLPDTLRIVEDGSTILPGTGLNLRAVGDFSGPAGDFAAVDLTKDVQWLSGSTALATINNTIGSKGFLFAPAERLEIEDGSAELVLNTGSFEATAQRFSGRDAEDNRPRAQATIIIGSPDPDSAEDSPLPVAQLASLRLSLREPQAPRGLNDRVFVEALGTLVRGDETLNTQDLSGQVVWDLTQGAEFASVSNASGRKGLLTVRTDQTVEVRVRARYKNTRLQPEARGATLALTLNPTPTPSPSPTPAPAR